VGSLPSKKPQTLQEGVRRGPCGQYHRDLGKLRGGWNGRAPHPGMSNFLSRCQLHVLLDNLASFMRVAVCLQRRIFRWQLVFPLTGLCSLLRCLCSLLRGLRSHCCQCLHTHMLVGSPPPRGPAPLQLSASLHPPVVPP